MLDFFPYPSGEGLSVGHARNYVPTDVLARYLRMRGYAVLHPMGWDAFGLPAENEALLRGRHPEETTREYAATYRRQLTRLACSYDWDREVATSDPAFYRWTQWGFLLLHRRGLVYRAAGWQWWCPRCRTILANEQVVGGRCWRHGDVPVRRRALEQWYVRTTAYADRLLADLALVDWPEPVRAMQRNWIGRASGAEIRFLLAWSEEQIAVFTTRPETLPGATFLMLAPEHPHAVSLATPDRRGQVEAFVAGALARTDVERMRDAAPADRPDTLPGVFTGAFAAHPLTGELMPVFVADHVLAHHGTGAVMGVPAEDDRDRAFAAAFGLPLHARRPAQTAEAVLAGLARRGAGEPAVRYRMRDWLISRQRFWGAPIPIVHCARCGALPVPEEQLPVRLPRVERYEPAGDGRSPLAAIQEFVRTRCPRCGGPAGRETDTLDGFADSNWYFLRFADVRHEAGPWNPDAAAYWLPVDWYIGGAEHAVMHLLYARFFTKVLYDEGLVAFPEPFLRLRNQGSMLSPRDGARMSKSRGNVVTPDEVIERYGADALRVAVMFLGPFDQDATWDPTAAAGAARFIRRLHALASRAAARPLEARAAPSPPAAAATARRPGVLLSRAASETAQLIEGFRFNVLVSSLMTLLNELERLELRWSGTEEWRAAVRMLATIIAPVAPFLAEEIWALLGGSGSVHRQPWPAPEAPPRGPGTVTLVLQVDGKVRDRVTVAAGLSETEARDLALRNERVRKFVAGKHLAGVVVVPGRLVNVVTR